MNDEGIYVIQIATTGYVKVGRTGSITDRLMTHLNNAQLYGGALSRIMIFPCANSVERERQLIQAVRELPGSANAHGKEVFSGVAFYTVVAVADKVVSRRWRGHLADHAGQPPARGVTIASEIQLAVGDVLADAQIVMGASPTMHLGPLRDALAQRWPDRYGHLPTAESLGLVLRAAGARTDQVKIAGRNTTGVRAEWLNLSATVTDLALNPA